LLAWKEPRCQEKQSQAKAAQEDPCPEPSARVQVPCWELVLQERAVCSELFAEGVWGGLGQARAVFDAEEPVWSLLSSHWIN